MADSNYSFVRMLAKFSAAGAVPATDRTGRALTAAGGAAVVADGGALTGAYLTLDGTGDYVTTPGTPDVRLGAGDFCIDFGVKTSSANKCLIDHYDGTNTGWQVFLDSSGHVVWWNDTALKTGAVAVNDGNRHHVAIFRVGGTIYLAVDGTIDGAGVANTRDHNSTKTLVGIGAQVINRNSSYDLAGAFDFVRITIGVSRWTSAGFTPPTLSDLGGIYTASVTETLGLSVSASARAIWLGSVAETLGLKSSANAAYQIGITETIALSASAAGRRLLLGEVSETLGLSDSASAKALRRASVRETLGLHDTPSAKGLYRAHVDERIMLYEVEVRAGSYDADLAVWAANLSTAGHSRYAGFGFNSFAFFDGHYYGCKSDGIYELSGALDGTAPIPWTVTFAETDFGSTMLKRVANVIVGAKSSGPLALKVVHDPAHIYAYPVTPSGLDARASRVKIGKGLKSRYWQFELASDVERVELEAIDYQPEVMSRHI